MIYLYLIWLPWFGNKSSVKVLFHRPAFSTLLQLGVTAILLSVVVVLQLVLISSPSTISQYLISVHMRWTIYEFGADVFLPRYAHLACLVDHQLHILGGQSGERNYVMDHVVFDLKLRQMIKVVGLDMQLGSHYCASTEDRVLYTSKGKAADRRLLLVSSGLQGCSFLGDRLPPPFRFPDIHRLGSSLVVSGCFTLNNLQAYGVWVLNTDTLEWRPIDTGSCLARGSWNRGVLHPATNRYVIFGHRERDLPSDYQFRRINFTHISAISLEAFAIYRNPATCINNDFVDLGLVLLYEPRFSNFSLLTEDGYRIHANLGILRKRWPAIDDFMRCQGESGTLHLQESYHVSMVFVRFLYTNSLDFEEAQSIDVLGSLLGFGRSYSCASLTDLAAFHLHSILSIASAPLIYRYASSAGRDGLRLRCLALMIAERNRLAHDRIFWKQYPKALRTEIIGFMPPNFKSPYHVVESEPEPIQNNLYTLHFLPTPDRSTLDAISPPKLPEPNFGDSKPRKYKTSSFLKFNTKRPSLASFFNFSSASSPPPTPPYGSRD
ncbi:hypothetical protein DSO57_1010271 [Entomophthora muscae]|uniref:Uncharacterized protein n=1 Tax=Entomophthora muscae TaxID=34485 RepID=A0ACC2SJC2_9FUNG|nr:hypothetical protein DSO57_1010271 [Entomophthora muscae]